MKISLSLIASGIFISLFNTGACASSNWFLTIQNDSNQNYAIAVADFDTKCWLFDDAPSSVFDQATWHVIAPQSSRTFKSHETYNYFSNCIGSIHYTHIYGFMPAIKSTPYPYVHDFWLENVLHTNWINYSSYKKKIRLRNDCWNDRRNPAHDCREEFICDTYSDKGDNYITITVDSHGDANFVQNSKCKKTASYKFGL